MSLDDLQATIEKLQDRIKKHRLYLSGNETATRQVLIDPMLLELGWDVSDPDQVALEYSAGSGRADYALKLNDAYVAVIEAKNLGIQEEYDDPVTSNPPVSLPELDEQEGRILSQTIAESNTEPEWISLKDLPEVNNKQPKPKHIKFPDGHAKKFRRASSVGVLRETAKWLINNGKLKTEDAQVPHPEVTNRYVTSSREQLHPSGQRFREPESVGANVYIEKDWTAQHCIDGAKALLEHCGVAPSTIQVSFDRV